MSFYRSMLAAVAAVAIASPVFAEDAAKNPAEENAAPAAQAQQLADNSSAADQQQVASDQQNATESKIDINKASVKELMKVKGINARQAKAIVAYRKKHGDFKSLDELSKVHGFSKVKEDNMKSIQDQLSI